MSTSNLTKPETPTRPPEARPKRIRYLLAAAIFGLASMGAGLLVTIGGDSTSPAPNPAPAASQRGNETFPGCLNDIECNGEPSQLPPGYWNLPVASPGG
jgi:hypothetical protein